ncbi:MAG TPA: hypothetical protein VIK01_03110 [Polyangiaceae bacterium]
MIFDLGSRVPPPKTCVPLTTCPAGEDCGYAPDGYGGPPEEVRQGEVEPAWPAKKVAGRGQIVGTPETPH